MTDDDTWTIKFDDEGALDTFIAMACLDQDEADELRALVEEHGYGNPIELEEKPYDDEI